MKKAIIVLLAVFALASCTTAKFGGLQMTKEMPSFEVIGEFEATVAVTKFLGSAGGATVLNLFEDATVDPVYDAIQREIGKLGGDACVDLEITYGATPINLILNSVTGSLYAPATATIKGKVVKY